MYESKSLARVQNANLRRSGAALPDGRLEPKVETHMLDGKPTEFINVDALVRLMQTAKTPQSKPIYRAFRAKMKALRKQEPTLSDSERRTKAVMAVFCATPVEAAEPISGCPGR